MKLRMRQEEIPPHLREFFRPVPDIPAKNLLLIPERFAIAMQDAGWVVRSRIAWCKLSAMPQSVRDRPTSAWEHIWMFSKAGRYYYDADAVRQPHQDKNHPVVDGQFVNPQAAGGVSKADYVPNTQGWATNGPGGFKNKSREYNPLGANLRNYWLLGPEPSKEEHYAAFPTEIPRRCILAGTSAKGACPACGAGWVRVAEREPGFQARRLTDGGLRGRRTGAAIGVEYRGVGYTRSTTLGWQPGCSCPPADPVPQTVLDPFLGSGTTAMVADRLGRDAIGIELSPKYVEIARRRLEHDAGPMLADVEVETGIQATLFDEAVG